MTQTMNDDFAPQYERDENGWILFPRDTSLRRELLGDKLAERLSIHPAKMNMHLCRAIVEKFTKEGDTILDPFGGVGTTLVAALLGRNVVLLELEEPYVDIAQDSINHLRHDYAMAHGISNMGFMAVVPGDNRRNLPIPCEHIITSPPYGADLFKKEGQALDDSIQGAVTQYASSNLNLGRLNPFLYNKEMQGLYKKMADSLKPGGTITITHRDRTRGSERILYTLEIMRMLDAVGLKLNWLGKWKAPGSIQSRVNEKKGAVVILDEDIINYRKPE